MALIRREYDQRLADVFQSIRPEFGIIKGDIGRYVIGHWVGGRYMDLKTAITKEGYKKLLDLLPLPPILMCTWDTPHQVAHIPVHNGLGEIQQFHFTVRRKHPHLYNVLGAVTEGIESCQDAWGISSQEKDDERLC